MTGRLPRPAIRPLLLAMLLLALLILSAANAAEETSSGGQGLILNVYLDSSGKALVTGYAEDISGLDFLNSSQFRLENESHQLYALTAGLTAKEGDLWTLRFDARGSFDDYRITFYMPSETSLGEINVSPGLGYLLSASNESLVADVQGWEVSDPSISIQYRQPLDASGNSQLPALPPYPGEGTALIMLIIAAALMVAGFGFAVFLQRKRRSAVAHPPLAAIVPEAGAGNENGRVQEEGGAQGEKASSPEPELSASSERRAGGREDLFAPPDSSLEVGGAILSPKATPPIADEPEGSDLPQQESSALLAASSPEDEKLPSLDQKGLPIEPIASEPSGRASRQEEATDISESGTSDSGISDSGVGPDGSKDEPPKEAIVISSEMEAVMQTLTPRERSVMSTLISHGGRMTQAEIRYETGTPKSSLTGILISLERRKLVNKKEWGRTNIIELSDWFLSRKERS